MMRLLVALSLTFVLGLAIGFIAAGLLLVRPDGSLRFNVLEDERNFTGGES